MKVKYSLTVLSALVEGAASHRVGTTRGSSINSEGGTFNDGVYKGGEEAEKIWEDNGSDCGYIFSFQDDVDDYIDENYVDIKGNWQSESYNRGVRAGADQVVQKYEKQCLEDTADECNDLGIAAAQELAFEYCPFDDAASFAPGDQPDYKEACREVATGICEGAVGNQVNDNGCGISPNDLKDLQAKCERQVNRMTGGDSSIVHDDHFKDDDKWHGSGGDDGYEYIVNTETPTAHPTKKKWGGGWSDDWHGSGDDNFAGIIRTEMPTDQPTRKPSRRPTARPTKKPHWGGGWADDWAGSDDASGIIRTSMPTDEPTPSPSKKPTSRPTNRPTHRPTNRPTARPTNRPTNRPTARPTNRPSARLTNRPTDRPTKRPSRNPTSRPTKKPHGWGGWNDDGYGYIETAIPTSSPTFAETEASSSEFRDGFKRGEERAEAIWRDNGSDCGYIFSFQDDVDKDLEKNCSNDSSFCQGARAGSYKVVKFYEKQCLEDTADECNDLGIAAAQELAFEYCPFDASSSFAPESQPDYKEACREVATGICKGAVGDQVMDNGCTISTSELKDLQDKCERQVDEMTGGSSSIIDDDHTDDHTDDGKWHGSGDDEFAGIVRTELPTSTPTYYPTKWGGWKGPITEPEPYSHGWGWKHKRGGKPTSHDNDWDN